MLHLRLAQLVVLGDVVVGGKQALEPLAFSLQLEIMAELIADASFQRQFELNLLPRRSTSGPRKQ